MPGKEKQNSIYEINNYGGVGKENKDAWNAYAPKPHQPKQNKNETENKKDK